jgi:hypothetical protein
MRIGLRSTVATAACAIAVAGTAGAVSYAAAASPDAHPLPAVSTAKPHGTAAGQVATQRAHELLAGLDQAGSPTARSDQMPSAVEDFAYPNADKILKDRGITLIRGDGHVQLADCKDATDAVQVYARDQDQPFCFSVTGHGGYLALDLPKTYMVRGNDGTTKVDMTVPGDPTQTYDITKNAWTPVGETADPDNRDHTLIEIRSTR